MSAAQDLARLQEVDTRIATLTADAAAAESLLRRDPELERTRDAAAAAERERQSREDAAADGEAEVNALQKRITSMDRKLYGGSVHNPQDLLEMQREVEVLRSRLSDAEDVALEQLGDAESAAATERAVQAALRDAEARRASDVGPLEDRVGSLRAELAVATAERERLAASVEPRALVLYRRVAQHRTPAVTGISGDSCGGCHLPLSNEERRVVKTGTAIAQCSNCDRILVP